MREDRTIFTAIAAILILAGVIWVGYAQTTSITAYPLATYWSESWRIYAASLVYAPLIHGKTYPWPWLDPGRALLDGIVFIFPGRSIEMFRSWVAFLILSTHLVAAFSILRLAGKQITGTMKGLIVLWGMLFLYQGPIYYHVLLGAILTVWLFDAKRPWYTLLVIACTSVWMGICRVNWFLMPASLAVLLYVLQVPIIDQPLHHYLKWPAAWGITGTIASFGTYGLHIYFSGTIVPFLHSEMNYGFFRFKLWPNEAYLPGLIPGIALVSLPMLILILAAIWRHLPAVHWARWVAQGTILTVFFVGSTYVSLRAGGGFDLHNYDTYILLLFITGIFWGQQSASLDWPTRSKTGRPEIRPPLHDPLVMAGLAVVPVVLVFTSVSPAHAPPITAAEATIAAIAEQVEAAQATSDLPILLIDGRHLLVFDRIRLNYLALPYEKVELMEMAMAMNKPYLERFRQEIMAQNFALIVSEVLVEARREVTQPGGYENNVWNIFVAQPILRYYEPLYVDRQTGLGIYRPIPQDR